MTPLLCLHVLLAAAGPALADIAMKFTRSPESVTAPVGDNVTFVCKVNVPGGRLSWRWRSADGGDQWTDIVGTSDKDFTSTRLDVVVGPDAVTKYYQCVVWYAAISLVSVPAKLTVARLIIKDGHRKRVYSVSPHNTVVIHCREPESEPPAVLQWRRETKHSKTPVDSKHGVLVIHNVTSEHSGTYICSARNELMREEVVVPERVVLKVERGDDGRARFLEKEDEIGFMIDHQLTVPVKLNSSVSLWCGAVGSSPPRVTWSRDKKGLNHRHDHELAIASFSASDEDMYTCTANKIRRSWRLVALQPPYWNGTAANVNASEGGSATVHCGALHGYPPPTVYWLLNAEKLSGKGIHANDTSLSIERVEKKHAGIVQCMACNDLGCAYDGALLSVVPVEISNQEYAAESSKSMHGSQPSKKHKKRKQLVPPSRPNVTRFSDESVMLTWTHANRGMPVEFFKIQYRMVNSNSSTDKVEWQTDSYRIQPLTHSHQIDGLIPNNSYKFRVAAVYSNKDNKQGPSSASFFLKKGGFLAPAPPTLISVKPLSPTSVLLNWTWYSDEGGIQPEGFYVYYRTVSTAGQYEKWMVPNGAAARSAVVSYLQSGTKYEFKMLAYTAQAPSNFSTIKEAKTFRESVTEETPRERAPQDLEPDSGAPRTLITAGGAVGATALLVVLAVALVLCRRAKRPANKEKSVPESGGANGYMPAKVPITITANPMHAEGGDGGVEMSFIHNNNTGNDDTLPHSRKNGATAPRQYV
ncbi:interference hedgehog-like [Plodia interpunctella]|uniref:interference hedgehog-like n=1 Tax=Plodia interpunctella TaxID=58824 RepID=UPI0023685F5B|nr:interference hedgehog-like [Plodia interpunctella]